MARFKKSLRRQKLNITALKNVITSVFPWLSPSPHSRYSLTHQANASSLQFVAAHPVSRWEIITVCLIRQRCTSYVSVTERRGQLLTCMCILLALHDPGLFSKYSVYVCVCSTCGLFRTPWPPMGLRWVVVMVEIAPLVMLIANFCAENAQRCLNSLFSSVIMIQSSMYNLHNPQYYETVTEVLGF